MVQFLSGKPMPVVEALKDAAAAGRPRRRRASRETHDPLRRRAARLRAARRQPAGGRQRRGCDPAEVAAPPREPRPADEQALIRPRAGGAHRHAAAARARRQRALGRPSSSATSRAPARRTSSCRRCSTSSQALPPQDITILFALGGHRAHTREEQVQLVGRGGLRPRARRSTSTRPSACPWARPAAARRLEVVRPYLEADLRICTGNIEYHYFAGFSGGAKAVVPGMCSRDGHPRQPRHDARADGARRHLRRQPGPRRHRRGRRHGRHRLHLQRRARRGEAHRARRRRPLPRGASRRAWPSTTSASTSASPSPPTWSSPRPAGGPRTSTSTRRRRRSTTSAARCATAAS